ncbi:MULTISPECIES: hypothetical protein [Helicobacter]|uniref:Uncharacterized protein n=1 Tax=Helicobacter gastrofelis TaxID=2849642 RepID=A0ABN6I6G4_9HELI|nr:MULTISPECIES: hypothetical protein [Helicobacter]BCZ19164.1 hypothetical protein NHP190012_08060 [Helicobacter sp. NHP19-012]GMB94507.1 hypothetical protein NHP21011_05990 [Helicobacter heilmannii]GMB96880.1 hypothetical protein NHP22001_14700 [Helicobacter sp. NHP22-001]
MASSFKYTQRDKARILKITTRTLQRWRYTKPELFAIIEAGFKMLEKIHSQELYSQEVQDLLQQIDSLQKTSK